MPFLPSSPPQPSRTPLGRRIWLTQPAFLAELRLARSRVFCHAFGHLQQVASRAVDALDRAMHDNNASPASRVSAARAAVG